MAHNSSMYPKRDICESNKKSIELNPNKELIEHVIELFKP